MACGLCGRSSRGPGWGRCPGSSRRPSLGLLPPLLGHTGRAACLWGLWGSWVSCGSHGFGPRLLTWGSATAPLSFTLRFAQDLRVCALRLFPSQEPSTAAACPPQCRARPWAWVVHPPPAEHVVAPPRPHRGCPGVVTLVSSLARPGYLFSRPVRLRAHTLFTLLWSG